MDQNISSKLRVTGEYSDERQTINLPAETDFGLPWTINRDIFTTDDQLTQIQLTQMISPSMVNQTSIALNNYILSIDVGGINQPGQVPNYVQNLAYKGTSYDSYVPLVSFAGGWSPIGSSGANDVLHHASDLEDSVSDDWSWLRGEHFFQAGGVVLLDTKRQQGDQSLLASGQFFFSGQFTTNPIADFLVGDAATFGQSNTQIRYYAHYPLVSPYFEDRWQVGRRLTVTGGVRLLFLAP